MSISADLILPNPFPDLSLKFITYRLIDPHSRTVIHSSDIKAAPDLIGKQLTTGFPYSLISSLQVTNVGGYDHCGDDAEKWAAFSGDPNYNLLNECCQAMNGPNPGGLGYTKISQATMNYMIEEGQGRDDFVRFWRLMAEAVVDHPRAFGFEL